MCKVLIIPAIKESRRKETMDFIYEMSNLMSRYNTDGLGYAAIDKDGELFSERWLNNGHFISRPNESDTSGIDDKKELSDKVVGMFGKALKSHGSTEARIYSSPTSKNYSRYGKGLIENDAVAITLHTRMATCDKGLANVHPFIDKDTSVIHNGVISNSKSFDLKLSTCDSESILISYLDSKVSETIDNTTAMANKMYGYYACGVFSRDSEGARILDVFKANNNNLSISYIFELETYVMASSDSDIRDACKTLGFTHGGTKDIENDYVTRINPFTGEVIAQTTFKSNGQYDTSSYKNTPVRHEASNVTHLPRRAASKVWDAAYYDMLKLTPSIEVLSDRETEEFETKMMMGY